MTEIVIAAATRTPIGALMGSLAGLSGADLGGIAIHSALQKAAVDPADVSEVIMGQILTGGQGMNGARQAALAAGLPVETTALTVNQVCGAGLRAVAAGVPGRQIRRFRNRCRRWSGEHVSGPSLGLHARRH